MREKFGAEIRTVIDYKKLSLMYQGEAAESHSWADSTCKN